MNDVCVIFWLVAQFLALAIQAHNRSEDGVHPGHTGKRVRVAGMERSNKHNFGIHISVLLIKSTTMPHFIHGVIYSRFRRSIIIFHPRGEGRRDERGSSGTIVRGTFSYLT